MVSYRVARTGKPHTIVEDLIIPASADMAGTILGVRPKTVQTMTSSNNTISRHINDMAGDVLKQLLLRIQASEFYALQLDESTSVAGVAQLLLYVRYIYGGSIKEDILFCKPLETRTTGEDICDIKWTLVVKMC